MNIKFCGCHCERSEAIQYRSGLLRCARNDAKNFIKISLFFLLFFLKPLLVQANNLDDLNRLKRAYPEAIKAISDQFITWQDGTRMPVQDEKSNKSWQEKLDNPSLLDQVKDVYYLPGKPRDVVAFNPASDPGRIRYEPFFRKMYGNSEKEVKSKLVTLYWMPKIFGKRYPLQVTQVNGVDKKVIQISTELEKLVKLHPEWKVFLENPGGTFTWRVIANTNRLSAHSFGMTIDINTAQSNYWQWDLKNEKKPITEEAVLTYRNNVPWEIVLIFEKYGFIWGGKWRHYDSMHFEYRPELLIN